MGRRGIKERKYWKKRMKESKLWKKRDKREERWKKRDEKEKVVEEVRLKRESSGRKGKKDTVEHNGRRGM
jgi:hypothetical protein